MEKLDNGLQAHRGLNERRDNTDPESKLLPAEAGRMKIISFIEDEGVTRLPGFFMT